jgi:hypothetical protein
LGLVYYLIKVTMKRTLTIIYFFVVSAVISAQSAYIPPDKPKLVIGIIVEQLRYDQLERIRDILPANGLKRMISIIFQRRQRLVSQPSRPVPLLQCTASPLTHGFTPLMIR